MSRPLLLALVIGAMCAACSGDDGALPGDGSTGDGSTGDGSAGDGAAGDGSVGMDGSTGTDGSTGADGSTGTDGSTGPDGSTRACAIIECQGRVRQCGDCVDNDGDGVTDQADPDCLGPCDNNEGGFYPAIPGSPPTNCGRDCFFDQDDGPGNDTCQWDFGCDPLEPGPARCEYRDPPGGSTTCLDPQPDTCETLCAPLTPNGCDCFGCCDLPGGSGNYVYVGTVDPDTREGTCSLGNETDPELCHPCTPAPDCFNPCGRCEICLGRAAEDLPADCFPPPPTRDAGTLPDGGTPDAATPVDSSVPPPPTCDDGRQACDVPGASPCADGFFCITGCCTFFG